MSRSLPAQLGPAVVILALILGAWSQPREFATLAEHAPYFLPSLLLVLASWGKLARGFGVHNLFRDDSQIFEADTRWNVGLPRLIASPAFWSGAGFAAAFGYAWIIAWTPPAGLCPAVPAAFPPSVPAPPSSVLCAPGTGWSLPIAFLAASAVFLWASLAALMRPGADLVFRSRRAILQEMLRVALGLVLGYAFSWAAWRAASWGAPLALPETVSERGFRLHTLLFLAGFLALAIGFRRARIALRPRPLAVLGLVCAALIILGLLGLALEAPVGTTPREMWLATWLFMIPVAVVFGLQNSLPCVSLACIGLGAMAMGQVAAPLWSALVWPAEAFLAWARPSAAANAPLAALLTLLALLGYLLLVNGRRHRHRIPGFDYDGGPVNPQDDKDTQAPTSCPRLTPVAALRAWRETRSPGAEPTLVLVCLSGGAYRASFWSSLLLDHLCAQPERFPRFEESVPLITGASGGMVAGAYFAALRARGGIPPQGVTGQIEADILETQTARGGRRPARRDSLSALAHQFAQWDLRDVVVPGRGLCDRGIVLERQWETLKLPLSTLEAAAQEGRAPSIILSPMLVETGATAIFSNLKLDTILNGGERKTSVEVFEVFNGYEKVTLATAVRLNATFPYISPAVSLPTAPDRRPVDAGYYDNFGIDLVTDYLDNAGVLDHLCPPQGKPPFPRIAVIQIRAFPADQPTPPPGLVARALQGLTTPFEGIASARRASQIFRNDQSLKATQLRYEERLGAGAFQVFTFEADADVSLSWHTRADEMEALRHLLDPPAPAEIAALEPVDADALQRGDLEARRARQLRHRAGIAGELNRLSAFLTGPPGGGR